MQTYIGTNVCVYVCMHVKVHPRLLICCEFRQATSQNYSDKNIAYININFIMRTKCRNSMLSFMSKSTSTITNTESSVIDIHNSFVGIICKLPLSLPLISTLIALLLDLFNFLPQICKRLYTSVVK